MAPADKIPKRKELLLPVLWGGLSPDPFHALANLQHCQLPKIILVRGGWTFPGLSQGDEAGQALPNWGSVGQRWLAHRGPLSPGTK